MDNFHYQRIIIIRSQKPGSKNLNDELKWFGSSLGLFGLRDKDKSCYRVFVELLKNTKQGKQMTSDDLAYKLQLSRGTVVHHLNRLMEQGIVMNTHNKYVIRVNDLTVLVTELERDIERAFQDLREVAEQIEKGMGMK